MSTKPNKPKNKKSKKRDWSFYAIVVCLIILAIPGSFFAYQGIAAMNAGRKPVLGDRLDDQFDNVITKEQLKTLETTLAGLDHVESVNLTLITATLRVELQTPADVSKETITAVNASAYAAINDILPNDEYFVETPTAGRYDLELATHNGLFDDAENFIVQIGTKNAAMDSIEYTFASTPYSSEWVAELWARQERRDEAALKEKEKPAEEETPEEAPKEETENPA